MRPERRPNDAPLGSDGMIVFRMNVGRNANADPKWMIPVICRRGGITKSEIHAAERFAADARKPDAKDPNIRFATLNETVTPAADSDMLVAAPARRYDTPRPFHKKHGDRDGKPGFKDKSDFKGKSDFKPKDDFKKKSGFKGKPDPAVKHEPAAKPEPRNKLFLKNTGPGDRPLVKKHRDRPGKN
jgi:ATP-dependent RNA helicase DeaD